MSGPRRSFTSGDMNHSPASPIRCCLALVLLLAGIAAAQCDPAWSPGFGLNGATLGQSFGSAAVGGRRVVVLGGTQFDSLGESVIPNIATWDGTSFDPMGSLPQGAQCFTTFDDGSGPGLYVGGVNMY